MSELDEIKTTIEDVKELAEDASEKAEEVAENVDEVVENTEQVEEDPFAGLSDKERAKAEKKAKKAAKKEEKRKKEEDKSLAQNIFETVAFIAIVFFVALVIKNYIGQPIMVDGNSMNDTLKNHDWVWANKLFYTPERNDVVLVQNAKTNNTYFIKRVIGLPNEVIRIYAETGDVYINGKKIKDKHACFKASEEERKIKSSYYNMSFGKDEIGRFCEKKLGKDEYFVMGDNRDNSSDSRVIGPVKRNEIKGHAVFRIWPFSKLGNFDK